MASRGAFGFRSAKQPDREDKKSKIASASVRGPPATMGPPTMSKLPTSSGSFFSRNKHSKPKTPTSSQAVPTPAIFAGPGQNEVRITATRPGTARSEAESAMSFGGSSSGSKTTVLAKGGKERTVLRRRAGSIEQKSSYARTESSTSSHDIATSRQLLEGRTNVTGLSDSEPRSIMGVTAPPTSSTSAGSRGLGLGSELATSSSHMASYNSRYKTPSPSGSSLPQPPTTYTHDSGSSTRRSESPGNFSRTSTPTSMSSQSPGMPTSAKAPLRTRGTSPNKSRPPVTWGRFHKQLMQPAEDGSGRTTGLSAVRESATSSSSSSTVKPDSRTGTRAAYHDQASPRSEDQSVRSASQTSGTTQSSGFPRRQGSLKYGLDQRSQNAKVLSGTTRQISPERAKAAPPRPSREGVPRLDVNVLSPSNHTPRLQASAPITESRSRMSYEQDHSDADESLNEGRLVRGGTGISSSTVSSAQPSRMPSPAVKSRPSLDTKLPNKSTKSPSPQSASSIKASGRFGFFSRRAKSPMEPAVSEKMTKKGPAAGTGHEGYGKYALRGRSGSSVTSASRGRSTSSTSIGRSPSSRKSSLTSEQDLDDFYKERLAPKPISGGGRKTDASSNVYMSSSAQSSKNTIDSSASALSMLQSKHARVDYAGKSDEPSHKLHHVRQRLPQREDTVSQIASLRAVDQELKPTLATRRSHSRSQLLQGAEPLRIPAPINTEARAQSPLGSKDTFRSGLATDATGPMTDDISEGREGNWLTSKKKPSKPTKSPRNWNFFQRSKTGAKKRDVPPAPRSDDSESMYKHMPVDVPKNAEHRQLPYYAMIDSSEQDFDGQSSSGQHTRRSSQVRFGSFSTNRSRDPSPVKQNHPESILLPTPPTIAAEFPPAVPVPQQAAQPQSQLPPLSQSLPTETSHIEPQAGEWRPRLQQVGRIPRVVSKRDRVHRPAPQSFSRPRPMTPRQDPVPSSAPLDGQALPLPEPDRPLLGIQTELIPQRPWDTQDSGKPASAPVALDNRRDAVTHPDEFLAFPPRIGSEVSGSSSSGILSYADAVTAVPRKPGTAPDDDEVWNEYNEFLDTVQSSGSLVVEQSNPFERMRKPASSKSRNRRDSSVTGSRAASPVKQAPAYPPVSAAPTRDLPSPPKRSKFLEPPNSPGTISDLIAGYDRSSGLSKHVSQSTTSRYSTSSIESEADSIVDREEQRLRSRANPHISTAQRLSQIYLQKDALLASRWLSFDRVLFSPAHTQLEAHTKDRVLVLDGLGNDQWSFFCAENYPSAMVYNLSPIDRSREPPPLQLPGVPKLPENHKHIHHLSLDKPFPFPQGFFTAAVFRFPAATTDVAYNRAVEEFMRVLKPGGFLEISMLDIEMVKMGNLARRALRQVKEDNLTKDNNVSLNKISDNIQDMLMGAAFENLNRCMLTVPVAGYVNTSRAESFDSASGKEISKAGGGSQRASNAIAKNLPKVGRWWFSSCYEQGLPSSIWNDKALLAECEARETGFKLLLCYAQKPGSKRRTKSF